VVRVIKKTTRAPKATLSTVLIIGHAPPGEGGPRGIGAQASGACPAKKEARRTLVHSIHGGCCRYFGTDPLFLSLRLLRTGYVKGTVQVKSGTLRPGE